MNAIRSVLFFLWMALTVVPWAVATVLMSVFAKQDPLYRFCTRWNRMVIVGGRWIMGIRNHVSGWENLPPTGQGVVFLVKHQSAWETICLPVMLPTPIAYVFKRELLSIPFFGWALGRLDMIHIDRSRRSEAMQHVIEQGTRLLAQGKWVVMFPEGTRVARGEKGRYQSGGARLAIAAQVPVIPVAVTSARCWPRDGWLRKHPGTVEFAFGPPIDTHNLKPADVLAQVETWIEGQMRTLDAAAYATA